MAPRLSGDSDFSLLNRGFCVAVQSRYRSRAAGVAAWIAASLFLMILAACAGCGDSATDGSVSGQTTGVTSDEIRIGSSLALGGHAW
jgi:hypothetical protein